MEKSGEKNPKLFIPFWNAFNISELTYKNKKKPTPVCSGGVGLEFNINHINRNSREKNYETELIYMCNYPPGIILFYLFPLSPPTSRLKILCIKNFLPNQLQGILGTRRVCKCNPVA